MNIQGFVADALGGKVLGMGGGREADHFVTTYGPLLLEDANAITAEAFNQDVFPAGTTWEAAHHQVSGLLPSAGWSRSKAKFDLKVAQRNAAEMARR